VIEDIRAAVHEAACAATDEAVNYLNKAPEHLKQQLNPADRDALYETAYLRLAEEYLGYLNRAFVYCEKIENGGYDTLQKYVQSVREYKHGTS